MAIKATIAIDDDRIIERARDAGYDIDYTVDEYFY